MREFAFGGLWPRRCTKSPRECVRILPRTGLARPRSPSAVSEAAAARVGLTSLRAARSPHPSTKQMVATSGLFSVRRDAGLSLKGSVNSRRGSMSRRREGPPATRRRPRQCPLPAKALPGSLSHLRSAPHLEPSRLRLSQRGSPEGRCSYQNRSRPTLLKKSLTLLQISFGLRAEGEIHP